MASKGRVAGRGGDVSSNGAVTFEDGVVGIAGALVHCIDTGLRARIAGGQCATGCREIWRKHAEVDHGTVREEESAYIVADVYHCFAGYHASV